MNSNQNSRRSPLSGQLVLLAFTLLAGAAPAHAGNADATMGIVSDPLSASVSRNPIGGAGGADFFVSYTVSITNPSNSSKNFRFIGDVVVTGGPAPTGFLSSRPDCVLTTSDPVRITCAKLEVAKQATVKFSVQFRTPIAGSQMALLGSLYFPVSSTSLTASASANTTLVKLTEPEYTQGFNTFVPKTGGTFFSGVNGNLAGSPGGVATATDPWTTTVFIPAINFTTTATAVEGPSGVPCAGFYAPDACFATDLTIPSAPGAFQSLIIYLRVDRTKRLATASINNAVIQYSKDGINSAPVRNCTVPAPDPKPGDPCIEARTVYPSNAPGEWPFDWEFKIRAVDNGRFRN